jgi:hypothetical protein
VPCTRSFFKLLKKLSVGALSQQLPLRLIEGKRGLMALLPRTGELMTIA